MWYNTEVEYKAKEILMEKTIGIVGGMGPLATCDLFHKIIDVTEAVSDQEHARVCIDSNTEIPDRTKAILEGGTDPLPQMIKSARLLEQMGADVLIMPCNTAHYFYERVSQAVKVPFLNMLDETAEEIARRGIKKVGLLATSGTIQSGVYKKAFDKKNIEMVTPSEDKQKEVMSIIYDGVKAGNYSKSPAGFLDAVKELSDAGAQTMVLGCTELPVAFDMYHLDFAHVDPTLILAKRAVEFLGLPLKKEYQL